jgi:hypothetical protein
MLDWKARQVYEGRWYKLYSPHRIGCCDCGLVHTLKFKNVKGKILFMAKREPLLTRSARKQKSYKCKPK